MNLHKAVQVMHRSNEFSWELIEEAYNNIKDSMLPQLFKKYYAKLYDRIKNGKVLI